MNASTEVIQHENQIYLNYLIRNQCGNDMIKNTLQKPSIKLNYQNGDGDTALHLAVETCNKEIIELLIYKTADMFIRNKCGQTPMDIVEEKLGSNSHGDWETIKLLLQSALGGCSSNMPLTDQSQTNLSSNTLSPPPRKKRKVHSAGGVRTSLHGVFFQLKLLRLFAQRAFEKGLGPFEMASEMNAAEKFDDIVFEYGSKETRFLQAKHTLDCAQNKITITNLRSTLNNENFSLQKYFVSFCRIIKNKTFKDAKLSDFIIITNTDFDFETHSKMDLEQLQTWKTLFEKENDFHKDIVLYIDNSSSKHRVNMEAANKLKEFMKMNLIQTALKSKVLEKEHLSAIKHKINGINLKHFESLVVETNRAVEQMNDKMGVKNLSFCCKGVLQLDGKVFNELKTNYKQLKEANQELCQPEKRKQPLSNCKQKVIAESKQIMEYAMRELNDLIIDQDTETIEKNLNDDLLHLEAIKEEILDARSLEEIKQQCETQIMAKYLRNTLYKDILKKFNSNLEEIQSELKEQLDNLISEISVIQVVLCANEFDLLFKEFFTKLHFITKYPDEKKLGKLIDAELSDLFNLMPSTLPGASLDRKMQDFLKHFKRGKAEFFTNEEMESFFDDFKGELKGLMATGLHISKVQQLRQYGVRFKNFPEKLQQFINGNDQAMNVFHLMTTTPRLSAIKVFCTIEACAQYRTRRDESIMNSYIFTDFKKLITAHGISTSKLEEPQKIILGAFQMQTSHSLLVIECHDEIEGENRERLDVQGLFDNLDEIITKNPSKKLILIAKDSSDDSEPFGKLTVNESDTDMISFSDLDEMSQQIVLETEVNFQEKSVKLTELIDVKSAIGVFDQMILSDFLEFRMNEKRIKIGDKKAFKLIDYSKDFYINRKFQNASSDCKVNRDEKDFYKMENLGHKIAILITSESGMGKSTALTSIASGMKDSLNHVWIVRINLNETNLKEIDENNTDEAIKYVTNMIIKGLKSNVFTKFQQKLFRLGLENKTENDWKTPQIVIMFDAFDEVSRSEQASNLIKALKTSRVAQIWVSTRDHKKNYLEERLETAAYTLVPFSSDDQIKFASDWWKWRIKHKESMNGKHFIVKTCKDILTYFVEMNLPNESYANKLRHSITEIQNTFTSKSSRKKEMLMKAIDDLDFSDYIEELRNNWRKMTENEENFTKNPLHLRMLIEVIYDKKFEWLGNIGLFQLFDQFIKMKFFIYYKRKGNVGKNETVEEVCKRDSDHLRQIHCELAMKVFNINNLNLPKLESKQLDSHELVKIGFLKLDEEDKVLSFIHRSYTEFFCSNYLIDNLNDTRVIGFAKELIFNEDFKLLRQFFEENPENEDWKKSVFT